MSMRICSLGLATPKSTFSQSESAVCARAMFKYTPGEQRGTIIYAKTGISTRHLVHSREFMDDLLNDTRITNSIFLPDPGRPQGPTTGERMQYYAREAGPLAIRASKEALNGFLPESITHLVTISCTGFTAPNVDFELIQSLGLRPTVERVHIGFMGCHGMLNGLRVANAFVSADSNARVLVCAVELCSLHISYSDQIDRHIANSIFSDGAAALVGVAGSPQTDKFHASGSYGNGQSHHSNGVSCATGWTHSASGSCIIPHSANEMGWTIGDHGFEMSLSRKVPELIQTHLKPWLESWLLENGLRYADVGSWAVHPGGIKILDAVEAALSLPPQSLALSRAVFRDYGNMSSPTIFFVLDQLMKAGAARPCVAMGFGPGLAVEAAIFR